MDRFLAHAIAVDELASDRRHPDTATAVSAAQLSVLSSAKRRANKVMRAATVASFSGWSCAIVGGITAIFGVFSATSLMLGLGLIVVGVIELRGSAALKRFDLNAPRRLGFNQIALGAMLVAYAGWSIYAALTGPNPYDEYLRAGNELSQTLQPLANLQRVITIAFYAAVMIGSLAAQGAMAAYYFTRRSHVAAYLKSTPDWAVETLRIAA